MGGYALIPKILINYGLVWGERKAWPLWALWLFSCGDLDGLPSLLYLKSLNLSLKLFLYVLFLPDWTVVCVVTILRG